MPPKPVFTDPALGPLTDDLLTRDLRVFQRSKGHRFSSDDIVTAFVAWKAAPNATHVLDLGCGLGSVVLTLAWKMPHARFVGVEAQDQSFDLLQRNVTRNQLADRIAIHHGDLRDQALLATFGGPFDLVTGTPPYFPKETALAAGDEQREYARIEHRGGVEAYIEAGARVVTPDGTMVLCGAAGADARILSAARETNFVVRARLDVVTRAHEKPLFSVWTLTSSIDKSLTSAPMQISSIDLRDANGGATTDANMLRAFCGFEGLPKPAPT